MPEHQNIKQSKGTQSSQRQIIPAKQVHASNSTAIIQRARIDPKSITSADVLQLQHAIGNRAVGRLLSEIRNSSTVQQVPVQRQKMPEEESLQEMFESKHNQATCPSCFATSMIQRQELEEEKPLQCMMRKSGQNRPTGLSSTLKARSPFKSPLPEKKQKQESQEKESQELPSQEQELQEQSQKPLRQIEYGEDISQNVVSERKRVKDYCPLNNYAVAEVGGEKIIKHSSGNEGFHAERLILQELENKGGAAKLEVTKFYSERMFCGPEKRNCLAKVRECKNAQLTYSVENNDQELFTAICSTIFGRSTKDVGSWMKLRDMKPIDTTS